MTNETSFWKRCSSCKSEIGFSTLYQVCSVSTCTRKRTGMVFCSVACWEMHLPMMRHREAYAVEQRSPSQAAWQRELAQSQSESSMSSMSSMSSVSSVSTMSSSRPPQPAPAVASASRAARSSPSDFISASPGHASPERPQAATVSTTASAEDSAPVRRHVEVPAPSSDPGDGLLDIPEEDLPRDLLIVVSKLKKYIKARSGMNTSDGVLPRLSDHVRAICREAIRNAARDGRKTVLDRDIPRPPTS